MPVLSLALNIPNEDEVLAKLRRSTGEFTDGNAYLMNDYASASASASTLFA